MEGVCKLMGSISGNMLNTVSPEVAKSIDLELSWKSVTKKRRSRRTVARRLNEGMKMNRSPKRVGDFSGSGSDKVLCDSFVMILSIPFLVCLIVASIKYLADSWSWQLVF